MTPTRRWGHRAALRSCPPGPRGQRVASRAAGGSHCPQWAAPAPGYRGSRATWRDWHLKTGIYIDSGYRWKEKKTTSLTIWIIAGIAEWKEHLLEPLFVVAPTLRFEHHSPFSTYTNKMNIKTLTFSNDLP